MDSYPKGMYEQIGPRNSSSDALLGKIFTVADVEQHSDNYYRLTLTSEDTPTIYFKYSAIFEFDYPFEVVGGLDLPEGFYCDYIEKNKLTSNYRAYISPGNFLTKDFTGAKPEYTMSFVLYEKFDVERYESVTLLLENEKRLTYNLPLKFVMPHTNLFKYDFTLIFTDKEIEMIRLNKLKGIKIGDKVSIFQKGDKLSGVIECLQKITKFEP